VQKQDLALAKKLLKGEETAFNRFFKLYYAPIFRFCKRRATLEDAEEIAIETLRHGIQRIETYRGEAPLLGWLYQVARSQVSAHYRRNKKHENLVLIEDNIHVQTEVEAMVASLHDTPDGIAEEVQHSHLVHYMLDSLPSDYGKVLEWKYIEGFSVEEIATQLETTNTAVQSMLARARDAFRKAYKQIGKQLNDPTYNVTSLSSGGNRT